MMHLDMTYKFQSYCCSDTWELLWKKKPIIRCIKMASISHRIAHILNNHQETIKDSYATKLIRIHCSFCRSWNTS